MRERDMHWRGIVGSLAFVSVLHYDGNELSVEKRALDEIP
jgi:hypothetical protein